MQITPFTPWGATNLSELITTGTGSWELSLGHNVEPEISYYGTVSDLCRQFDTLCFSGDKIERVIYNDPATIVFWKDGTKTVVKCQKGDTYNPETGLAMCIIKRVCGNKANYNNIFTKWLPKEGE